MTRTASRSACRAAAATSSMATPSRTKRTWTSSTASISTRALYRPGGRVAHAAPRHRAHARRAASSFRRPHRTTASSVMAGDKQVGTMGSAAERTAALPCCASTASATRLKEGQTLTAGKHPAVKHRLRMTTSALGTAAVARSMIRMEPLSDNSRADGRLRRCPWPGERCVLHGLSRHRMGRAGL